MHDLAYIYHSLKGVENTAQITPDTRGQLKGAKSYNRGKFEKIWMMYYSVNRSRQLYLLSKTTYWEVWQRVPSILALSNLFWTVPLTLLKDGRRLLPNHLWEKCAPNDKGLILIEYISRYSKTYISPKILKTGNMGVRRISERGRGT